ncbi:hypothetical protein [Halorientalis salina]|uniref:hypothetical protein n=1 Tax=Halorientalis salina TaxID=2932266 RepID=UPI0010AB5CBC|nr:hypothetical protein [Halorientalis salina]
MAPAAGATDGPVAVDSVAANETNESSGENASLGTQISSFMQASSAETNGSVDAGMWEAEFNASNGTEKAAVVENRIRTLDRRVDRLEDRLADLEARHENGSLPEVAYMAQASQLTAEIESLERSINETDSAAKSVGVNDTRLDKLRTDARNMSGRAVANDARGLSVVSPPGLARGGPPGDAGTPGNGGPAENAGNARAQRPADDAGGPGGNGPPGAGGNGTADADRNETGAENPSERNGGEQRGPTRDDTSESGSSQASDDQTPESDESDTIDGSDTVDGSDGGEDGDASGSDSGNANRNDGGDSTGNGDTGGNGPDRGGPPSGR